MDTKPFETPSVPVEDPTPRSLSAYAGTDVARTHKALEIQLDLQWKVFVQVSDLLTKGVSFYFLIVITSVALIYQAKLPAPEARKVAILITLVSAIVAIGVGLAAWILLKAMNRISRTLRAYNEEMFVQQDLENMFRRTRYAGVVTVCLAQSILGAIVIATGTILVP